MKIELSCTRELNFEGPDPSKIDVFSVPILRGVPGPHRIYLFADFGVIFGPLWAPPEPFFRRLSPMSRPCHKLVTNLSQICHKLVTSLVDFGRFWCNFWTPVGTP